MAHIPRVGAVQHGHSHGTRNGAALSAGQRVVAEHVEEVVGWLAAVEAGVLSYQVEDLAVPGVGCCPSVSVPLVGVAAGLASLIHHVVGLRLHLPHEIAQKRVSLGGGQRAIEVDDCSVDRPSVVGGRESTAHCRGRGYSRLHTLIVAADPVNGCRKDAIKSDTIILASVHCHRPNACIPGICEQNRLEVSLALNNGCAIA